MAKIGMKYWAWAPFAAETNSALPTYTTGMELGEAIKADVKIANSEGQLYAGDALCEEISEFSSASIEGEVDDITLAKQAAVYGATMVDGELGFGADDSPPFGGTVYLQVLVKGGVKRFRTFFYPKVKAKVPDDSAATKGSSITFGTDPVKLTVFAPLFGKWRYLKDHASEAAAKAYVDTKLGVATWYAVNVQVNGATTGEGATPSGTTMVASAGAFVLTLTGTVTKLYDNGVDKTTSIAAGVYTVSNITAAHDIAVIF